MTFSYNGLERVKQIIVLMVGMTVELHVGPYLAHISNVRVTQLLLQICSRI